jgi:hypothetical protein
VRSLLQNNNEPGAALACALAVAICALAAPELRAEGGPPSDPDEAVDTPLEDTVLALEAHDIALNTVDPSTVALGEPPAPLAPLPTADLRFGRVDPLELLVTAATGGAGCAVIALPLGACGALSAVYGVGAIVGVLGLGLPALLAISGAFAAYCISVPAFFALGPISSQAAFVGAVNGLALFDADVPVVPMLIAVLPSIGIALFGSSLAFVGTGMLTFATIGVDPQAIQASSVLVAAGLLTAALSGPVAVIAAVTAGQLFSSIDDESATASPVERAPAVSNTETRAVSTGF